MSSMPSAPAIMPTTTARIFAVAFAPPCGGDPQPLGQQRRQPAPRGQRHDRCEPGARHEIRIIEPHR